MMGCVYNYTDYRHFLRDVFAFKKQHQTGFSYRQFCKHADIASAGYVKLVLDGHRNLSLKSIQKFIRGLKLTQLQAHFFTNLVFFNQSDDPLEKKMYFEKMSRNPEYRKLHLLQADQFEYFNHWYHIAIRELVALNDFCEDPLWISKKLKGQITPKQAEKSINLLLRLKLIQRNDQQKLCLTNHHVSSGNEAVSLSLYNYHLQMLDNAKLALAYVPADKRDISAVTIAVDANTFEELKKEIQNFRKKLLALAEENQHMHNQVIQLNMQLFPLSTGGKS